MRLRSPEKVRTDALRMGIRKASAGCLPCAEQYFDLARASGASGAAVAAAINATPKSGLGLISRGQLLKLAAGSAGALALGPLLAGGVEAGNCYPKWGGPTYWGSHLYSHYPAGKNITQQFYAYKGGLQATQSIYGYDSVAASSAGYFGTYLFWDIYGSSGGMPTQQIAYNWGQEQAQAAINTWISGPYAGQTGGPTIFGTVIPTAKNSTGCTALNGWAPDCGVNPSPWFQQNQWVLQGWLDYVASQSFDGIPFVNGLYTQTGDWDKAFVKGWSAGSSRPFVLWVTPGAWSAACTGNHKVPGIPCFPCDPHCLGTPCEVEVYMANVVNVAVSGMQCVIWHFWPECPDKNANGLYCYETVSNGPALSDYDVAIYDPVNGGYGCSPKLSTVGTENGPGGACSNSLSGCP